MNERKLTTKNVVFLSYCDSENNGENYKKVIKPLALYLLENNAKIYCMRDPLTDSKVELTGEDFVESERKRLRRSTSLFVAYITKGYFTSDECMREIAFIKRVLKEAYDKPKIIFIYDSNCCEQLKQEIYDQSWWEKTLVVDTKKFLTAPDNLEYAKQEIVKAYYEKLKKSYDIVYKKSHLMSDMVLHSLKAKYICTTVSKYIIQSKELTHKESGYELHIVTDEIDYYDKTVLSSMAIALNLQKNVKYIYYGSEENRTSFDELVEVVKGFIRKNEESRRKVDRYIRYVFATEEKIANKIEQIDKRTYSEFLDAFPNKIEILEKYKQYLFRREEFKEVDNIVAWLRGKRIPSYNYAQIKFFNDFLQNIIVGEEDNHKHIAEVLKEIAVRFNNLFTFSDWNVGNLKLKQNEIVALEDNLNVSEEIRGWIGYNESEGEAPIAEEYVEEILKNMHYINISQNNLPNIAFNFCIFYEKGNIGSAWYRTAKGIANFKTSEESKTDSDDDIDNDLIIRIADNSDNDDFIYMFYSFITTSYSIQKELENYKSSLLEILGKRCKMHDLRELRDDD